jgi:hypothetical protein
MNLSVTSLPYIEYILRGIVVLVEKQHLWFGGRPPLFSITETREFDS